ncbi:MAG: nuclear transport factor 2 family protein [Haloferacaceae archaeon]
MDAAATVRDYYEALRRGEPLYPYFAEDPDVVKVGVRERLVGYDAVAEGLREQSRRTDDWTVESRDLRVHERGDHVAFADVVRLSWRDVVADRTYDLDTRWTGTLEAREDDGERSWLFVGMHVSAPWES